MSRLFTLLVAAGLFASTSAFAENHHHMAGSTGACTQTVLACASTATPAFARDGTLWLAWAAGGQVSVAHSADGGRSFSSATAVTRAPAHLDAGGDSRPKIVIGEGGQVIVTYSILKDDAYDGQVLFVRSTDGGAHFSAPHALTDDPASQRFESVAFDPAGRLFAAWLDKRDAFAARKKGGTYPGAALAYAWWNPKTERFAPAHVLQDNTCECCRTALAFAGPGRPVLAWRNIYDGTTRDHAVSTFTDPNTPGPVYRVSVDDWRINACPHHGPGLAVGADGTYHIAWFTEGTARQGLFYARSTDGGRGFSTPLALGDGSHQLSRPQVLALPGKTWLAWKDFDGEHTRIQAMSSRDGGKSWSSAQTVAETADASDQPVLVGDGVHGYLSWLTHREGYRLIPLESLT